MQDSILWGKSPRLACIDSAIVGTDKRTSLKYRIASYHTKSFIVQITGVNDIKLFYFSLTVR